MDTTNLELKDRLNDPAFKLALRETPDRSFLLPHLFKFRGKPLSLQDHPQFRVMYPKVYPPETVYICGRQIGKTLNLCHSELLDAQTIENFHILYVAPQELQAQRYNVEYLSPATKSSELPKLISSNELDLLQNVTFKTFANGGVVQLAYAKTSSDRVRGVFADRIDFDEVQDQLFDHIPIISESLTASDYGIRVYTGTAKNVDNTIETLWRKSSQCEWVMKCSGCNHYNIPNLDGDVLKMIRASGIHCAKCGKKLNVREGKFVPGYKDRMSLFAGYHVPQIIVPFQVENTARWARLVHKFINNPLTSFLTEALGISASTGARLITIDHIRAASTLPGVTQLRGQLDKYIHRVSGIDWGGTEVSSFTVHTVVGITADGQIDTLYARRYSGFDPEETIQDIARAHNFYRAELAAADYGNGYDRNVLLSKAGVKVIQMFYTSQHKLMSYSPIKPLNFPRWILDRTTAMELVFLAIRFGRIRFPPQQEFEIYTNDILSPYEDTTEKGGFVTRKFLRAPGIPDDFFHALVFASVLAMRRVSDNIADIVPDHAMANTVPDGYTPPITHVDPKDFQSSGST